MPSVSSDEMYGFIFGPNIRMGELFKEAFEIPSDVIVESTGYHCAISGPGSTRYTSDYVSAELTRNSRGFSVILYFYLSYKLSPQGTRLVVSGNEEFFAANPSVDTPKKFLQYMFEKAAEMLQKPSSTGNVKAYFDPHKITWGWHRPGSEKMVAGDDGNFYNVTYCNGTINVIKADGTRCWKFVNQAERNRVSNGSSALYTTYNGSYYEIDALVPVYANRAPFNEVVMRIPLETAESDYEYMLVDNEKRYLDIKKSRNPLTKKAVHSYSVRVESLIPADKLFLKGKSDLYAKRPKEETPFLGFELEALCSSSEQGKELTAHRFKEYMPFQVMCKDDGSIGGNGFETVSIPATLDFWKESNLSQTLDAMRSKPYNMRSYNASTCGVHIHVSRSALSVLDLQKLERFLHNPDNRDFISQIAGRGSNTYQTYNAKLFSDRKNLSSRSPTRRRGSGDGFSYLSTAAAYSGNQSALIEFLKSRLLSSNILLLVDRLKHLAIFFNRYISFSSMYTVVLNASLVEGHVYRSIWCTSGFPRHLDSFLSPALERDVETSTAIVKEYLYVLAASSPVLNAVFQQYLPEWSWPSPENSVTTSGEESWKAGIRKSTLPFKRALSLSASQNSKGPVGKGVSGRYDVLNTTNNNTVEFRLFKGTMNPVSFFRYLEFVDALVRFAAFTSASDEGVNYTKFLSWIVNDAFNVARYENLVSFLISKDYIARKAVRRKNLPEQVNGDSNVTGLVVVPPVGFEEDKDSKPIGIFSTNTEFSESNILPVIEDSPIDWDEEDHEVDDDDYCSECDGPCQA